MTVRATLLLALLSLGCEAGTRPGTRDAGPGGLDATVLPGTDAEPGPFRCAPGTTGCDGNVYWECSAEGDSRGFETACDVACDPGLRCVECRPGARRCVGTV